MFSVAAVTLCWWCIIFTRKRWFGNEEGAVQSFPVSLVLATFMRVHIRATSEPAVNSQMEF